ncbi:MAG: deoxyribodipyrimidine photolyase, partial [Myxococcota bacterium]
MHTPDVRVTACNEHPERDGADFVLYWMIAQRRLTYNFALQRAVERAGALKLPLVILEPLRCGYRWASDRLHRFALDGMADHAALTKNLPVTYYPYVEPEGGHGKGLLAAMAERAAVVVTDDWPCFFVPRMVQAAADTLGVRVEKVDSNGILPMYATDRVFTTAYSFRRGLHKMLPSHLGDFPEADPLSTCDLRVLDEAALRGIQERWAPASRELLTKGAVEPLAQLPIDHAVAPSDVVGGMLAARARLDQFIEGGLERYKEERNEPSSGAASDLSPYLHWGQISAHEVFTRVMSTCGWTPEDVAAKATGKREGWWGASEAAEAFIDELVTWREIGYNMAALAPDQYDQF